MSASPRTIKVGYNYVQDGGTFHAALARPRFGAQDIIVTKTGVPQQFLFTLRGQDQNVPEFQVGTQVIWTDPERPLNVPNRDFDVAHVVGPLPFTCA